MGKGEDQVNMSFSAVLGWVAVLVRTGLCIFFLWSAVDIRLHAVRTYGRYIHEFDPWFNFRATEYLVDHGYSEFVEWFDYESWYPMGRPVGKTVYPGLMLTSSAIYHTLNAIGFEISINDVCVFIPPAFSVVACTFLYLFTYEVTLNHNVATAALGVFSILPAHLSRSVGGGYDNESVAVSLIIATFYFWVHALRRPSLFAGIMTGLSYVYMVATWGGYTFVLNMIAGSCGAFLLLGRFSWDLYTVYVSFFIIGTYGALQFPIVGWQPFDSLEQSSALIVFVVIQFYALADIIRSKYKPSQWTFRVGVSVMVLVLAVAVGYAAHEGLESGKLLHVSTRVRSLFVQHTKTGNPLVDSVAEHSSTQLSSYQTYFHVSIVAAAIGLVLAIPILPFSNQVLFFYMWCVIASYFSLKMVRLVLLLAAPVAASAGMMLGWLFQWSLGAVSLCDGVCTTPIKQKQKKTKKDKKDKKDKGFIARWRSFFKSYYLMAYEYKIFLFLRILVAIALIGGMSYGCSVYYDHCQMLAPYMSEPQILLRGQRGTETVIINDIMDSYLWLKQNTPEDARVLAWWDYGYQINGVGNRTTIADGNTWNHEHIALLGRSLISPEKRAHRIIRHLADYVLVWTTSFAGFHGDDLAKCPHMARIASSVYFDIDHREFYMAGQGRPSKALGQSLLYRLHSNGYDPHVEPLKYFHEVYHSENFMIRIYKVKNVSTESKAFVAANHTYPPALDAVLKKRNDFDRSREDKYLNL